MVLLILALSYKLWTLRNANTMMKQYEKQYEKMMSMVCKLEILILPW